MLRFIPDSSVLLDVVRPPDLTPAIWIFLYDVDLTEVIVPGRPPLGPGAFGAALWEITTHVHAGLVTAPWRTHYKRQFIDSFLDPLHHTFYQIPRWSTAAVNLAAKRY